MKPFRTRNAHRAASRAYRLDPRQESRSSLALILLMGLATLSVMATTQVLFGQNPSVAPTYAQR